LQAIKSRDVVFNNDIGCYSMSLFPPVSFSDTLLCMGASLGLSIGMQYVVEEKVLAIVGDSTFFHACLPGLVNAVHHNDNFTLIVLDNDVTAMTGQQPHPGTDRTAGNKPAKKIIIEDVAKAIGVEHIAIVDPYDVKAAVEPIKAALDFQGPSLVVSRRACALHNDRLKRKRGERIIPNYVDKNICKKPYTCIRNFHCPAIVFDEEDMASEILGTVCDGCGVCAKICPFGAIKPLEVK
jgi:indolepyruvate ferredoxin oxidoreductase alpha subunit